MTRVDFYHLQNQGLENVLPKLLEKAYETGKNIKIKVGNDERVEFINSLLWTYDDQSFIPHGSKKDGFSELQPVFISTGDENPNNAVMVFLVDGAKMSIESLSDFERLLNIFDGNVESAVTEARGFWKELKAANAEIYYWQQDENGRWKQKA